MFSQPIKKRKVHAALKGCEVDWDKQTGHCIENWKLDLVLVRSSQRDLTHRMGDV